MPETGGLQTWETIETTLAPVTGSHSIYLKFIENGSSLGTALCKLNWLQIVLPPAPTTLAATPSTATQTTLSWSASPGATGYELLRVGPALGRNCCVGD